MLTQLLITLRQRLRIRFYLLHCCSSRVRIHVSALYTLVYWYVLDLKTAVLCNFLDICLTKENDETNGVAKIASTSSCSTCNEKVKKCVFYVRVYLCIGA